MEAARVGCAANYVHRAEVNELFNRGHPNLATGSAMANRVGDRGGLSPVGPRIKFQFEREHPSCRNLQDAGRHPWPGTLPSEQYIMAHSPTERSAGGIDLD